MLAVAPRVSYVNEGYRLRDIGPYSRTAYYRRRGGGGFPTVERNRPIDLCPAIRLQLAHTGFRLRENVTPRYRRDRPKAIMIFYCYENIAIATMAHLV